MIYVWFSLCMCVVFVYGYFWLRYRHARRLLAGLPSYPQLPLLGHLHKIIGGGKALFRVLHEISEENEKDMLPFLIFLGPCPILITYDSNDVKAITNNLVDKPYYYSFGRIWLGDGLVLAPVQTWKHNIKNLAGTFSTNIVEGYQNVFNAQAQKLVERLKEMAGRDPFDIANNYLAYTTLEAICQTALGVPKITENIITEKYFVAFNRALELLVNRGLNLLYHIEWIYKLTPSYRELRRCVAVIHSISEKVIIKRNALRKEICNNEKDTEDKADSKFKPYIDILMDLSESDPLLTDQQIKAEIDTIILGGQETIATTLFFTLQMISRLPHIQEKLQNELKSIFKGSTLEIDRDDLAQMHYAEAVIKETLRMYPPIPVVMRYADQELALKSCRIPVGTAIGINAWGAGRSRKIWGPDALVFRPERWFESEHIGEGASFLAFSYGRRACIGKKYAMAFMKTILAYCIRELEFIADVKRLELKIDIALRPISGHLMKLRLRNNGKEL